MNRHHQVYIKRANVTGIIAGWTERAKASQHHRRVELTVHEEVHPRSKKPQGQGDDGPISDPNLRCVMVSQDILVQMAASTSHGSSSLLHVCIDTSKHWQEQAPSMSRCPLHRHSCFKEQAPRAGPRNPINPSLRAIAEDAQLAVALFGDKKGREDGLAFCLRQARVSGRTQSANNDQMMTRKDCLVG